MNNEHYKKMPLFDKKINDKMSRKLIRMTLRRKMEHEIKKRYMVGNSIEQR